MTYPKDLLCEIKAIGGLDKYSNILRIYYMKPVPAFPTAKLSMEMHLHDGAESPRSFRTDKAFHLIPIIKALIRGYKKLIPEDDPILTREIMLEELKNSIIREIDNGLVG